MPKRLEIQPGFLNLGHLNSGQILLPTEPLELLALEQRIDGIYP